MRVWLNAFNLGSRHTRDGGSVVSVEEVQESVRIPLDFYPLCMS